MPQPLHTKLSSEPHMSFLQSGGLAARPDLAVVFAQAIEEFAACEVALGVVYLALNSERPDEAFQELDQDIGFRARLGRVRTASDALSPDDQNLVSAVCDRAQTAAKMRNTMAHGEWGYSEKLPAAVLLTPAESSLIDMRERLRGELGLPTHRQNAEVGVMVYECRDFEAIKTQAINARAALDLLTGLIMSEGPGREELRKMILSDPDTEAHYAKHRGSRR